MAALFAYDICTCKGGHNIIVWCKSKKLLVIHLVMLSSSLNILDFIKCYLKKLLCGCTGLTACC